MESVVRSQHCLLTEIRDELKVIKACVLPPDDTPLPERFKRLETIDEVTEFNDKLSDQQFVRVVKRQMAVEKQDDIRKTIVVFLTRLASKSVWQEYSFKGQKGKLSFYDDLPNIYNLLKACVNKHHKQKDGEDLKKVIHPILVVWFAETKRKKEPKKASRDNRDNE